MERLYVGLCTGVGVILSLLGGLDGMLIALMLFVVLDFISGMLASAIEGKWSSKIGHKGIIRKLAYFLLICFAHIVDIYIMGDSALGDVTFRELVIGFILANEGISIIENMNRIGIPIPKKLITFFELLKRKEDEKDAGFDTKS